jgi:3-oxoacyl-[acyl-carrier-protein] synthase III
MPFACITGLAGYLPETRLTNADLERMVDTSDEWITSRSGIRERRVAAPDETTSDLAAKAGLAAIADAGLEPGDIGMLVLATCSPDMAMPSTACRAQVKMGLRCPAFDVMAACSGFVYALQVATDAVAAGRAEHVLVVGAEAISRYLDFTDRATCVLFGDGAGAVVLSAGDEPGVRAVRLGADGAGADLLTSGFGAANPPSAEACASGAGSLKMAGSEVFKFAVRIVPSVTREVLADCGMTPADLRWLVPHQANERITLACAERLDMPADRIVNAIGPVGNTSSASIPLALSDLYTAGNLGVGDEIAIVGFGAGLTWGAAVIRWIREAR